jgi:hypothetical protein
MIAKPQLARPNWSRPMMVGLIAVVFAVGSNSSPGESILAAAQPDAPRPKEGRIVNLDSAPFTFRLARKHGTSWSSSMTIGVGEAFILKAGGAGEVDALEGISGDGAGHVTIEYPALGGKLRLQLPALDRNQNAYVPFWYHVKDSNGVSRMIQAATPEIAKERQKQLQAEPAYGAAELEAVKRTLRANFLLYD